MTRDQAVSGSASTALRWQAFPFQPRAAYLPRLARRGRREQAGVDPQPSDQGRWCRDARVA